MLTDLTRLAPAASAWLAGAPPTPSPSPSPSPCSTGQVSIDLTDGTDAPGLAGFAHTANIVAAFTLIACLLAVVGGIFLATSGRFADHRAAVAGRLSIIAGVLGAFGVGIAAALVNFAFSAGTASC
jgi:hypothetical protein